MSARCQPRNRGGRPSGLSRHPHCSRFCMFIRRKLLNEIGMFDADAFRLGYGEENEFCMLRRRPAGAMFCATTRLSSTSAAALSTLQKRSCRRNMRRLLARHPDYMRRVTLLSRRIRSSQSVIWLSRSWRSPSGWRQTRILHIMHGAVRHRAAHPQPDAQRQRALPPILMSHGRCLATQGCQQW